tara:strand:+ start:120 stop:560 length:441 start_codon:yes stop_codon:yes gene_type:complete
MKKKFMPKEFDFDGVDFEGIALTDELSQKVKECESSIEMILTAADFGLSCEGTRAMDDEELMFALCQFWLEPELDGEELKALVGEKICEISGISDFIKEKKEYEKIEADDLADKARADANKEPHINGSDLPDLSTTLGELNADAVA